ncbi:MAG: 2-oxo acid dehydrogenase subunit E2 [Candidatus Dormibacteraeota bacterium]|uniref:Dihydrolipoamide acetyltransferase component of pyruvate dehydrogenase complex n=1 Tax=Candidatus Dormiibacter inghamiae TaxID=3127013 RepID=A0A934NBY8_9BACT|nr:2-oxo acid dehydrogenase subunit E2 [Candidatus Dormibacteraeota bacterium]MBJ7607389.1 2-oxo acid dehydrogenase subunit E2 [Candidatus Dormibacteraeota bacterium]
MSDVNMPKLSDTMEEGTVLEWKQQDGAEVKKGEALAEIESDKASFEIEAEADGVLHIAVQKGQAVPVGEKIASIGGEPAAAAAEPEEKAAQAAESQDGGDGQRSSADGTEHEVAAGEQEPGPDQAEAPAEEPEKEPKPEARSQPEAASAEPSQAQAAAGQRPEAAANASGAKASPLARRLASEMGVDLGSVQGSGPEGRIVKEDVVAAAEQAGKSQARPAAAAPARTAAPSRRPVEGSETVEPNRMQATIAKRMAQSKTTVPHFYVTVEAEVDEAVRLREQLKSSYPGAEKVTMTDLLTRACAIVLTRFPEVNSSWIEGRFERKRGVSIGLAVPPSEGLGLLVPVVHDADRKDLVQISIETRQVIERARSGKPGAGDLEGGSFSISNLGMYGVDEFSAIINPPESAILAVGAIKDVALVRNGQLVAGKVMRMTLSVDHRVFYGATAAQFMAELKRLIENPISLVLPPEE